MPNVPIGASVLLPTLTYTCSVTIFFTICTVLREVIHCLSHKRGPSIIDVTPPLLFSQIVTNSNLLIGCHKALHLIPKNNLNI